MRFIQLLKIITTTFILVFLSCEGAKKPAAPPRQYNPNWPTVTLEAVGVKKLYSTLRYGGYLRPRASYPVTQAVDAVIRKIPVKVGQFVRVDDPLYSFQQVLPGTSYGAGWALAQNTGYVSLVNGVEGHVVKKGETVLVISDLTSAKLDFYLSNQDADHIQRGQDVYLAEFVDDIQEIEDKLRLHIGEEAQQRLLKEKKEKETLLELTKGKIFRIPITPKEGLGVFSVQVEFPRHAILKFGRFVVIEMRVDPYEGIAVDQRYLLRRYGKQQVTVVRGGIIDYQEVEIGKIYGNMVQIKSGLKEGDKIVVATNRYVRPGVHVNVRDKSARKDDGPNGASPPPPPGGQGGRP